MKKISLAICFFLIAGLFIPGCGGLMLWQKGKYFRSEIVSDFTERNIQKIGVVALSNGRIRQGAVTDYSYPDEILYDTRLHPDTSSTGPSLELAKAISSQLEDRIYQSVVLQDVAHSREITVKECIELAKKQNCGAVMIVYYTGHNTWTLGQPGAYSIYGITTSPKTDAGFLYLTNSAIFDCAKGDRIWHNTNYGIVEGAHLPNIHPSGSFIEFVPEAFTDVVGKTYIDAAPLSAAIIFKPPFWTKSFAEIPSRGEKRKKL